jgi:transmembrane sensor
MTARSGKDIDRGLREEAARWFAAMRGPRSAALRASLESWLAEDERHRRAYHDAAEIFAMGKVLHAAPDATERVPALPPKRHHVLMIAGVVGLIAAGAGVLVIEQSDTQGSEFERGRASDGRERILLATGERQRIMGLPDGSSVILDRATRLTVVFSAGRRLVEFGGGRARFDVAHDGRPFSVAVGTTRVTARGTVFDVARAPSGLIAVHMLHGVVDVEAADQKLQLSKGENATLGTGRSPAKASAVEDRSGAWVSHRIDCDRVPLGSILTQANAHAGPDITLASAELASVRVSGTFRLNDRRHLANNLALALQLQLVEAPSGSLTLSRGP